ncbi:hypothetical protein MJO28_008286 [Puccinia striiformis f. sp. tritici]|uniref:Uncharacterized protein n=1 Tax=Puccinia striiformis f. sp. tritici TaxID=168172 RepID=A0ACC0EDG6_9BASI|nr:hypothetical protein MJO28_008286 [Puccinia striiformis f. sp. tritici]
MLPAGVQTIRFRKPTNDSSASKAADSSEKLKAAKHFVVKDTLIAETINRNRLPWAPKLSVAFRILILVRFCAAMYSSISDCDESFNFWEPTHYLVHGKGFQTWEYSPDYSIRSWFFILLHSFPAWLASKAFPLDKRPGFFAIRAMLAFLSSYTEAKLYRAIADHINPRAARYYLSMSLFSAAMWSASSAYLPSAFAMQAITLAYSYVLEPVSSKSTSGRRTFFSCLFFVIATVAGWPFVGVLALPFALEELSLYGDDEVMPASRPGWAASRFNRLFVCGLASVVIISVPMVFVDWLAYGKLVFVPLNIVLYNVFPDKFGAPGGGPELYGAEPPYFYLLNLSLNFNIVFILALISIPLVLLTSRFSRSKGIRLGQKLRLANQTPSANLLIIRLVPVYAWIALMSQQPHKEERFMHPIYTLISFNAAVSLSLMRGWIEDIYIQVTSSPYKAGRTSIFSTFTRTVILTSSCIGIARILALQNYYHGPLDIMFHFQYNELPIRAIQSYPAEYTYLKLNTSIPILEAIEHAEYTMDLGPLKKDKLTLCLGESWFRFPTQFLVPDPINVEFVKTSVFDGILPSKFVSSTKKDQFDGERSASSASASAAHPFSDWIWSRKGSRLNGGKFNAQNKQELDRFVDVKSECDYAIGMNYPDRSNQEWRGGEFESDTTTESSISWEPKKCVKVLDPSHTPLLIRTVWVPFLSWWSDRNLGLKNGKQSFGELCLYKRKIT